MDKDYNGYALRLMQSISYTKQYDLDTGEMSYRDGKAQESLVYCKIPNIFMENIISRYPVKGSASRLSLYVAML